MQTDTIARLPGAATGFQMSTQENILSTLLDPFRGIDIPQTYAEHASFIDFGIFLVLFIAIAHAVFHTRFPGRSGKAISVTVGLMLAVSLAAAEARLGFNLASLGPIAGAVVVFLVALTLFGVVRGAGASWGTSAAVALVATYFVVRALAPEIFESATASGFGAWLSAVLWLAFIILIIKLLMRFWRRSDSHLDALAQKVESWKDAPRRFFANRQQEQAEKNLVKAGITPDTKREIHDSKQVISDLQAINDVIRRKGRSPEALQEVGVRMQSISKREAQLQARFKEMHRLIDQAESYDASAYNELSDQARRSGRAPKAELDVERLKIDLEEKLRKLEEYIGRYDSNFRYCMNMAVECLRRGDLRGAMSWVAAAIRCEEQARDTFRGMKRLEGKLDGLTEKGMRMLPPGANV